uniref:dATP/dGTP diphosphohydrolase domain-containing protein n=1 Tax=Acetomicrobium sp. S15 = DSM 107314 TaxID=2529858 RepID=UPI001E4FF338
LRYDLIPSDALRELAKVYTVGAEKYGERNWEKGMSWGRALYPGCAWEGGVEQSRARRPRAISRAHQLSLRV